MTLECSVNNKFSYYIENIKFCANNGICKFLLHYFILKKIAKSHHLLVEAYGEVLSARAYLS